MIVIAIGGITGSGKDWLGDDLVGLKIGEKTNVKRNIATALKPQFEKTKGLPEGTLNDRGKRDLYRQFVIEFAEERRKKHPTHWLEESGVLPHIRYCNLHSSYGFYDLLVVPDVRHREDLAAIQAVAGRENVTSVWVKSRSAEDALRRREEKMGFIWETEHKVGPDDFEMQVESDWDAETYMTGLKFVARAALSTLHPDHRDRVLSGESYINGLHLARTRCEAEWEARKG